MASHQQTRIQAYLEKNKIGPLFEVRRAPPRRGRLPWGPWPLRAGASRVSGREGAGRRAPAALSARVPSPHPGPSAAPRLRVRTETARSCGGG